MEILYINNANKAFEVLDNPALFGHQHYAVAIRVVKSELDRLKQENENLKTAIELIRSLPLMNGIQFEDLENQYRETIDRIKTAITREYLP